nr:HNH endonuclease [Streptomyces sp. NBC_00830]
MSGRQPEIDVTSAGVEATFCPECGKEPKRWRRGVCDNCYKHLLRQMKEAGTYTPARTGPKPTKQRQTSPLKVRAISLTAQDEQRFWSYVSKTENGCWPWQGALDQGYGSFSLKGTNLRAHRVAYTVARGELPEDKVLDHLCRNRPCVNPDHLELVTVQVNTLRGEGPSAQAAKATHCPQGHPYDEQNTWLERGRKRHCRTCNKLRQQARRGLAEPAPAQRPAKAGA